MKGSPVIDSDRVTIEYRFLQFIFCPQADNNRPLTDIYTLPNNVQLPFSYGEAILFV